METFEPRQIDGKPLRRWFRAALQLFVRSPWLMTAAIGLVAAVDALMAAVHQPEPIAFAFGGFVMPIEFGILALVARIADLGIGQSNWRNSMLRPSFWRRASLIGASIATPALCFGMIQEFMKHEPIAIRGDVVFATIFLSNVLFISGTLFVPALIILHDVPVRLALHLSARGFFLNGEAFEPVLGFEVILLGVILAGQMIVISSAFLVFYCAMLYVAYRDIFEGRSENQKVATSSLAAPATPTLAAKT